MQQGGKTIGPYTNKKVYFFCHRPKRTSRNDLEPFKGFIADIKDAFVEQSHVIAKVFPEEMDMFYLFVDRALEDVVSCSKRITHTPGAFKVDHSVFLERFPNMSVHCWQQPTNEINYYT